MENILDKAVDEIKRYKTKIIAELMEFAKTDLLLFWDDKPDLYLQQEKLKEMKKLFRSATMALSTI